MEKTSLTEMRKLAGLIPTSPGFPEDVVPVFEGFDDLDDLDEAKSTVIGNTRSGKPIHGPGKAYRSASHQFHKAVRAYGHHHPEIDKASAEDQTQHVSHMKKHTDFSADDHEDAAKVHHTAANKAKSEKTADLHRNLARTHETAAQALRSGDKPHWEKGEKKEGLGEGELEALYEKVSYDVASRGRDASRVSKKAMKTGTRDDHMHAASVHQGAADRAQGESEKLHKHHLAQVKKHYALAAKAKEEDLDLIGDILSEEELAEEWLALDRELEEQKKGKKKPLTDLPTATVGTGSSEKERPQRPHVISRDAERKTREANQMDTKIHHWHAKRAHHAAMMLAQKAGRAKLAAHHAARKQHHADAQAKAPGDEPLEHIVGVGEAKGQKWVGKRWAEIAKQKGPEWMKRRQKEIAAAQEKARKSAGDDEQAAREAVEAEIDEKEQSPSEKEWRKRSQRLRSAARHFEKQGGKPAELAKKLRGSAKGKDPQGPRRTWNPSEDTDIDARHARLIEKKATQGEPGPDYDEAEMKKRRRRDQYQAQKRARQAAQQPRKQGEDIDTYYARRAAELSEEEGILSEAELEEIWSLLEAAEYDAPWKHKLDPKHITSTSRKAHAASKKAGKKKYKEYHQDAINAHWDAYHAAGRHPDGGKAHKLQKHHQQMIAHHKAAAAKAENEY